MQRNAIIDAAAGDVLVFCDDDFYPAPHFVETIRDLFARVPDVVGCNTTLEYDGAAVVAMEPKEGIDLIANIRPDPGIGESLGATQIRSLYGCNMAVRMDVLRAWNVRFDDRLAFYGWLEDLDFSRRLARHGRLVRLHAVGGVHLGTSSGRVAETWLGFSQIVNPAYLYRKRVISLTDALRTSGRCFAANMAGSLAPSARFRRRRLRGNLHGVASIITDGPRPERVSALPSGR